MDPVPVTVLFSPAEFQSLEIVGNIRKVCYGRRNTLLKGLHKDSIFHGNAEKVSRVTLCIGNENIFIVVRKCVLEGRYFRIGGPSPCGSIGLMGHEEE